WQVDGADELPLDGCMDVDLESSACTNALPIHRLGAATGECEAPAAYVRTTGRVERLEQTYRRAAGSDDRPAFDYHAPRFEFTARLEYDQHGLVLVYPGIARRAG
ncbi:MAG: putative glycolipid-binding domain-containing protein, partial [Acidimicrobiia bacterium]|nr:putative glycolipid-binding domain-containing protein [Acidimicrobiia bacterium]